MHQDPLGFARSAGRRLRPAASCRAGVRLRASGPGSGLARRAGLLLGLFFLGGCTPGVHWTFGRYEDIETRTRSSGKLLFVYFRNWYDVECTRFEDNVLANPEVLSATSDMTCIPLDMHYDQKLATSWGLTGAPSYAILAPGGKILEKGQGAGVTVDQLLESIRAAKARLAPESASTH